MGSIHVIVMMLLVTMVVTAFNPVPSRMISAVRRTVGTDVVGARDVSSAVFLTPEDDEEYFESEMDRMTDKDKLPIALGALGAFSLPFIVGLIYLYSNQ